MKPKMFKKGFIYGINALLSLSLVSNCLPVGAMSEEVPDTEETTEDENPVITPVITPVVTPVTEQEEPVTTAPASLISINGIEAALDSPVHDGDVVTLSFGWANSQAEPQTMMFYNPLPDKSVLYSASIISSDGQSLTYYPNEKPNAELDSFYITEVNQVLENIQALDPKADDWITFDLGSVDPDASGTIEISLLIRNDDPSLSGLVDQGYWMIGDTIVPADPVEIAFAANSLVEVSPGNGEIVEAGDLIEYQMEITNPYDTELPIVMTDVLDQDVTLETASLGSLSVDAVRLQDSIDGFALSYDPATRAIQLNVGSLAPGVSLSYRLQVRVGNNAYGVINQQASIAFGDLGLKTNLVQNPLPGQQIGELTPGNYEQVDQGQLITYRIYYENQEPGTTDVSIVNPLDAGVSYYSSSLDGQLIDNPVVLAALDEPIENQTTGKAVSWELKDIAAGQSGFVLLNVLADNLVGKTVLTDQAGVQVGDGSLNTTQVKENPTILLNSSGSTTTTTETIMTETAINGKSITNVTPGENNVLVGPAVTAGDQVTYTIDWSDYDDADEITIVDVLDYYGSFVSASLGTTALTSGTSATGTGVDISYNSTTKTVTWTIDPAAYTGDDAATLIVQIDNNATRDAEGVYENSATLTADTTKVNTNIVQNPVYPLITENFPGTDTLSVAGTVISTNINYVNNQQAATDVIVIAPVSAGVTLQNAWLAPYTSTLSLDNSASPTKTKYTDANGSYVEYYAKGTNLPTSITANGKTIQLNLPSDAKYLTLDGNNGILLYYIANAPTGSGAVSMNVSVNKDATASISTEAIVQLGTNDGVYTNTVYNNLSTLEVTMEQQLGTAAATTAPLTAQPSDQITYTMTVKAPSGGSNYKNMVVMAPIETGITVVSGSITAEGAYRSELKAVEWELGELAAGESKTLAFKVTAPAAGTSLYRQSMDLDYSNDNSTVNVSGPSLYFNVSTTTTPTTPTTPNQSATNQNTSTNDNTTLYIVIAVIAVVVLGYVAYSFYKNKNKKP